MAMGDIIKELELKKGLMMDTMIQYSHDTFYFKDLSGGILLSSKAHAKLWGVDDPQKVIGKTDFDYFPKEFAQEAYNTEQEIIATGKPIIGLVEKLVNPDGTVTWLLASKYPFYNDDKEIIGTWGISQDITSLKKAEEELLRLNAELEKANRKLKVLSVQDSLSGLYNHRHFCKEITRFFDNYTRKKVKDPDKDFAMILFDIDNFKHINDTYGHPAGDRVIKHIAKMIKKNTRSSDQCFRYGGDEFAVLLPEITMDHAKKVAEKIRQIIEKTTIKVDDLIIQVTVSMGVATFDRKESANNIVEKADRNLYLSKKQGKNRVN